MKSRRGVTLLEVTMANMLVAMVLLGALQSVATVFRDRTQLARKTRAEQLAHQLMVEILQLRYRDPGLLPLFGPELGEPLLTNAVRSSYNDIDDLHLWTESPPGNSAGVAIANGTGWRRTITVELVSRSSPGTTVLLDEGVKRVTVTVRYQNVIQCELVTLKTIEPH